MDKCDCWHKEERIVGWCGFSPLTKTVYECYGTKEREECHCMGDRSKCNFYPEVREKAKKAPATIDEAISHFTMGITHDIFNEPVTSYANLAIEALRQMQEKEQNEPPQQEHAGFVRRRPPMSELKPCDFLGNEIRMGDEVAFFALGYRIFTRGIVARITPKCLFIDYDNSWNYDHHEEHTRQEQKQVIDLTALNRRAQPEKGETNA